MSEHRPTGDNAYGDEPQGPPNVYLPLPGQAPDYQEYADPAAAHGWENGYDATAELPRVTDGAPRPPRH